MSRNSSPPCGQVAVAQVARRERRAAAVGLHVGHQLVDLLVGEDRRLRLRRRPPGGPAACGRCAPGSRPPPRRRRSATGPRSGTPSRLAPWQVMQLRWYSARPAASAADSDVSSAACAGAKAEYRAPVSTRPTMRPATLARRRRCLDRRRTRARRPGRRVRLPAVEPPVVGGDLGLRVRGGHRFPSGSGRSWRRARPTRRRRSASSRRPRSPRSPGPA